MTTDEISARCAAIEECYEFMLAYAGQGLNGDEGSHSSGEVRDFLRRAFEALSGLAEAYAAAVKQKNLQPASLSRRRSTGTCPGYDQLATHR